MINITENNLPLCRRWLLLGICALAISGLLSLSVILLRLPVLSSFFSSSANIFDISLVIHVNLSVLVWMCSIKSIVMSLFVSEQKYSECLKCIWYISVISTLIMVISMLIPETIPLKNNYIPVLNNKLFLFGLWSFLLGILFNSILSVTISRFSIPNFLSIGVCGLSLMMICVFLCFIMSYKILSGQLLHIRDPLLFYENLFWGGGHLLQFVFSQTFFIVYLVLLYSKVVLSSEKKRFISVIFTINTAVVLFAPIIYLFYNSKYIALVDFFTWHMRIAGALIPFFLIIFSLLDFKALIDKNNRILLCSVILFIYGGILGVLTIDGNVTIPAHYHGSIVGMTIAFMGFVYWILPKLRFNTVNHSLANFQIYIYSFGQFLHITGLEWLGGYGALRKVAYLPALSSVFAKICFIIGGIMSVIGGFMFVLMVLSKIICSVRSIK